MSHQTKGALLFLILSATFILTYQWTKNNRLRIDENPYHAQIQKLIKSDLRVGRPDEDLFIVTPPTYSLLIAAFAKFFNNGSIQNLRLYSLVFSMLSVLFFYKLCLITAPSHAFIKTMQYSFLPVLFPFFFMIYTDACSLFFILLTLWSAFKKWRWGTAVFGFVAILVRQNNVVWYLFIFLLLYHEENGDHFSWERVKQHLVKNWGFLIGLGLFVLFVIVNQGVAIGDKNSHPLSRLHLGNIYFLSITFFFLFLPLNLSNLKQILVKITGEKKWAPLLLILFLFYLGSFVNDHPYNQNDRDFFLRNQFLSLCLSTSFLKFLTFLTIVYSILSLSATRLRRPSMIWLYPFSILFLAPSWLIDPRYYIIPFTLFILFKEEKTRRVEYSAVAYYVVLGFIFLYKMSTSRFFL